MSLLFIHVENSEFHSRDGGAEYETPEIALALGVRSAVAMLSEEINRGGRGAAIEISIRQENGIRILRSVVAISVFPLIPSVSFQ
jgi:hypothetical protein